MPEEQNSPSRATSFPIRGTRVRLDIFSLAMLAPLAVTLGWAVFPMLVPEMKAGTYGWMTALALLGFVSGFLLRISVLHLAARAMSIPVGSSILGLFGPMMITDTGKSRPGGELIIAVAHLLSLLILGVFFLWIFVSAFGETPPLLVLGPAFGLALAHLGLFVLHLLPGYPLDGGRVLRAILVWWKWDFERATDLTVKITFLLAALLGLGGVLLGIKGALVSGLFTVVAGVVLYLVARDCRKRR